MPRFPFVRCLASLLVLSLLTACAGHSPPPSGTLASGKTGGYYKVGRPYQIKGTTYYPQEDYSYDETGIASWYGSDFHGEKTANGEVFNKNELTAAHHTLPMPSLARVTNLDNGRSLVVRVNDRGPFSGARIIDVSQRAAQLLGFERQGTAKVRVQVLADESKAIADAMRRYGTSLAAPEMVASAAPNPSEPLGTAPIDSVAVQPLAAPPPQVSDEVAHRMMATIKPVQEVRQVPVSGANQIYIQAGAFTKLDNATRLQQQLGRIGSVTVVDVVVKGVEYHRVRLGPVVNVAEADQLLKKVTQAGASGARIVID